MSQELCYDLCVIGAGLNGVSIARDAAGRGLSVLLVDAQDLAGASSSATSKIVYGGVFGLENGSFLKSIRLFKEREAIYKNAQHLFSPIECIMPLDNKDTGEEKVGFLWRAKLWLYNKLGGSGLCKRAGFCVLNGDDKRLAPLKNPNLEEEEDDTAIIKPHERLRFLGNITDKDYALKLSRKALTFGAYKIDDTRLVICNAVDAAHRGVKILTYTSCDNLEENEGGWRVSLRDVRGGDKLDVMASMVVNATGPWVCDFIDKTGVGKNDPDLPSVKFMKSSHLIFDRQYEVDSVYVLRQNNGSNVCVMPYEDKYTLVGASQEECNIDDVVDPRDVRISEGETCYLIDAYNAAFEKPVKQNDIVFAFSSVRPVLVEGSSCVVNDDGFVYYHKRFDTPLVSVYGGEVGEYRSLAQGVVDRLMLLSGRVSSGWTAGEPLLSAKFFQSGMEEISSLRFDSQTSLETYMSMQMRNYPWLPQKLLQRYVYAYGTQMEKIVRGVHSLEGLGEHYGDDVYEAELNYLIEHEWVFEADDVLWRRSKLALHVCDETEQRIRQRIREIFALEDKGDVLCA